MDAGGFICPNCKESFIGMDDLIYHSERCASTPEMPRHASREMDELNEGKGFICPQCKMTLPSMNALLTHVEKECVDEGTRELRRMNSVNQVQSQASSFICPDCKLGFMSIEKLLEHSEVAHPVEVDHSSDSATMGLLRATMNVTKSAVDMTVSVASASVSVTKSAVKITATATGLMEEEEEPVVAEEDLVRVRWVAGCRHQSYSSNR